MLMILKWYNISTSKFLRKPTLTFSLRDRQDSGLPVCQPSKDEIKRVFDKFDSNRDGKISPGEYKAILKALGKETTTREIAKIFEVADLDGDGFIDFKDFLEVHKRGGGVKTVDILGAFQICDSDGDGKISAEDVFALQRRLGEKCSLQDCQKMVKAVDTNKDGVIDMDEFMAMMTGTVKL
ncbi:hypothetical protein F0562_028672 [Nyssa sinensis]|uniref:EF-hand domain-containing protein n=1 Tax=Nyssa sinensis TaxID=561372 RepID=A0A5J5B0Q6_9ASTE|nr:hypothetical protein F0562_028672 [Nyssa sinensis]